MPLPKRLISWLDRPSGLGNLAMMAIAALLLLGIVGYFQMNLSAPANITGDHLFTLVAIKSYINGHGFRFDSQLGFPGVHDNIYFPSFDLSYRLLMWLAARLCSDPFVVVHIVYIVCFVAMACAYYWTLRRLGAAGWIAVIGALASIVTPYLQGRSFGHDTLALSFSVPFGLGLALLTGQAIGKGAFKRFFRDPYVLTAVVVVATSGIYYAFFTVMGVLFVGAASALGERRLTPLLAALVVTVSVFVLLLFSGYGFDLPLVLSGKLGQPHRQAFEQLLYGMDFTSASMQFRNLPHVEQKYQMAYNAVRSAFYGESGEWPGLPLTLTILGSPFIIAIAQSALPKASDEALPKLRLLLLCGSLMLFYMLFCVRGGIGFIFNLLIAAEMRATERVMPFLTFGAALILCLAAELARGANQRWLRYGGPLLAAALLIAAMPKYVQGAVKWQRAYLAQPVIEALQKDTQALLQVKDNAGLRAVLELPVMPWPETEAPTANFNPYEMQTPYIYDRAGSPTHWSYGLTDRQPAYLRVSAVAHPIEGMVQRARKLGFDSVLIEKRAYSPENLTQLQAALAAQLAPACRLYDSTLTTLYALNRSSSGTSC